MARYFVIGNLWLMFFALLIVLGRTIERTQPVIVSFFGRGWIYPGTYSLLVALCVLAAAACLALAWKTRHHAAGQGAVPEANAA